MATAAPAPKLNYIGLPIVDYRGVPTKSFAPFASAFPIKDFAPRTGNLGPFFVGVQHAGPHLGKV